MKAQRSGLPPDRQPDPLPDPSHPVFAGLPRTQIRALRMFAGGNPAVFKFLMALHGRVEKVEKALDATRKPGFFGK